MMLWNINKKHLEKNISNIAWSFNIDILILIESNILPAIMLNRLNEKKVNYKYNAGLCEKISIYSVFPDKFIKPIHEAARISVREVKLPGRESFLLVATHFISKKDYTDESQVMECINLTNDIIRVEDKVKHDRTVLTGDLNMNPFETGMVAANALHSTMCRKIALKGKRTVQNNAYAFFYNPMWNLFGDLSPGPVGTYYYPSSNHKSFYWNMFDQVLVRPAVINKFESNSLRILDTDGVQSLLKDSGVPNNDKYSDHLPIIFSLNI